MHQFLVYDSKGLKLLSGGPEKYGEESTTFEKYSDKVRNICTSKNGKRVAWIGNGEVCVVEAPSWQRIGTLHHPKAQDISFSPRGNYLAIFDTYQRAIGDAPAPNLSIYNVTEKKLVKAYMHQAQLHWQPQWTDDESFVGRMNTSEVTFYKPDDLENHVAKKTLAKVRSYSLSPSTTNHFVAFFVPCLKDSPAYVHLYKYPDFKDASKALANKSFFQVDQVEIFWNKYSNAFLCLTTAPPDKTGTSYYGDQMLFYLSSRGDSTRVTFDKPGNIRSVCWCPNGKEFVAIYGTAPARATLFDVKCNPIKTFGDNSRNVVMVNPPGNVVMIGAMGNISSRMEFWDLAETKLIGQIDFADITHMEWSPCGQYVLTSTCSPRLRVNNGYRIFHYTTSLLYEHKAPEGSEVFQTLYVPNSATSKPFKIQYKPIKGIELSSKAASEKRYIPPSQRAAAEKSGEMLDSVKRFLSERDCATSAYMDPKKAEKIEKRKKKKEEQALKNAVEIEEKGDWRRPLTEEEEKEKKKKDETFQKKKEEKGKKKEKNVPELSDKELEEAAQARSRVNRIKNLRKKIAEIGILKSEQEGGKTLVDGQLKKIKNEDALAKELEELSLL